MRYSISLETLWYLLIVGLKYLTIFPIALVFVSTTNPSEFASSLNKLKINFKICYSVSLMLRYFPGVIQDYTNISNSQQTRGIDISKNASIKERITNITHILSPLILSSLDRIDTITNAMILSGFCKEDRRVLVLREKTYSTRFYSITFISSLLITSLISRFYFGVFFYYPF
ncbi:MAG: energy-coupling factor transporter transmembrane protein EcfT [Spirochaetaceae bacterium]|nr:energy-coupling factor transporter transmembrane protein EcfT [Spirochaetaceae bacterium]